MASQSSCLSIDEPCVIIVLSPLIDKQGKERSADILTPTISKGVKFKLAAGGFDDGNLMLTKLKSLYALATESTFVSALKDLFTSHLRSYDRIEDFITHFKTCNERLMAQASKWTRISAHCWF
jgi:hypothetical protein